MFFLLNQVLIWKCFIYINYGLYFWTPLCQHTCGQTHTNKAPSTQHVFGCSFPRSHISRAPSLCRRRCRGQLFRMRAKPSPSLILSLSHNNEKILFMLRALRFFALSSWDALSRRSTPNPPPQYYSLSLLSDRVFGLRSLRFIYLGVCVGGFKSHCNGIFLHTNWHTDICYVELSLSLAHELCFFFMIFLAWSVF